MPFHCKIHYCRRLLCLLALFALGRGTAEALTLGGHVYDDPNALVDGTVSGTGTDGSGLFVNLLDEFNTVVATTAVAADGTYSFSGIDAGTVYSLLLSQYEGTVGDFAPTAQLLPGWVYTGENIGSGVGNDGNPDGVISGTLSADEAEANFGLGEVGTLKGHIYRDDNGNGTQDGTDPSLGAIDVKVKDHFGNIQIVSTDLDGNWSAIVPVGAASIVVDQTDPDFPANVIQTEGVAIGAATVAFNTTTFTGNNGYFPPAVVTGHVYIDTNGNGAYDPGEPNLAGVDVDITNANGDPVVVTTDANGIWTAYVPEGPMIFSVDQNDPDFTALVYGNFTQTEGNALSILLATSSFTTDAGADGYFMTGTVTGHLYIDSNDNGVQDLGEPDLPNEQVTITDSNGIQQTVQTDFTGIWSATVPPGLTSAKVLTTSAHFLLNVPAGSVQTEGTDPTQVTAVANSTVSAGNDGYFVPGVVTGHLYVDINGNGTQDPGEPNLPAVEVVVTDANGVTHSVKSASSGDWKANVPPGSTSAKVNTSDPVFIAAVTHSYVQTEGSDPTLVTASANATVFAGVDGYFIPAIVTGHLYFDTNGNGSQNIGEPDLANVDVIVKDSTGVIHTVSTNSSGVWTAAIAQGTTLITVSHTDPDFPQGAVVVEGSDPQTIIATSNAVTQAGDNGYYIPATVNGHLYLDRNGNGFQENGEPDLVNVDVLVTDSVGAQQTVSTNASGNWTAVVPPGQTSAMADTSDTDFTALVLPGFVLSQGANPSVVMGVTGTTVTATPAGFFVPVTVTGHLYVDVNGNGSQDSGEPGLADVDIVVTDSNSVTQTVTTNLQGDWTAKIPPGSATAKVTTNDPDFTAVLPPGYTQTQGNDPTTFTAVVGSVANGGTDGYKTPVLYTISGQVRFDSDRNGSFLDNDQPLAGFTVKLYGDANNNQILDVGTDLLRATLVTGSDGRYTFTGFPNGHYIVKLTPPSAAFVSTKDTDGNNNREDPLQVANSNSTNNDFLEFAGPQGWFYDTETGDIVPGGNVLVTGVPAGGVATVLFDGSSGQYAWVTNGVPGDYTLAVSAPAGYTIDPSRPASPTPLVAHGQPDPLNLGSNVNLAGSGLQDFSAGANTWYLSFTVQVGDPKVGRNNIPVLRNTPVTFNGWRTRNTLGGQNGVADNPDGDAYTNLQEFAFNLNPASGVTAMCPLQMVVNANNTVDAKVHRLAGAIGITFELECISNLALSGANGAGWTVVQSISPTVVNNGDGTETDTYANLAQVPALASGQGYVRVKLTDQNSGTVARTQTSGWASRALSTGVQTYGNPFLVCPIYTGTVSSATSNAVTLDSATGLTTLFAAGKQYYVEVTAGTNVGHRWEIDEANSSGSTLFIDTANALNTQATVPASLVTDHIAVREHNTLKSVFPTTKLHASNSVTTADRILVSAPGSGGFSVYWLYSGGGTKWLDNGNATLADIGNSILMSDCQGVFVLIKGPSLILTQAGQVRHNAVACNLKAGANLITGGWPLDQSPNDRLMTTTNGFTGNGNPQVADKLSFWTGDDTPGLQGYNGYFLFSGGSRKYFTQIGNTGLANDNGLQLFVSLRAAFIQSVAGKSNWVIPLPWTP